MACVTLKRPLEWIDPSMSPESGSSSPTHMIISNSPPHHGLRSPKRMCLQSIATSSAITNANNTSNYAANNFSNNNFSSFSSQFYNNSTFLNNSNFNNSSNSGTNSNSSNTNYFKPISSTQIAEQIRDEMIRLRMIRNKNSNLKSKAGDSGSVTSPKLPKMVDSDSSSLSRVCNEQDGDKKQSSANANNITSSSSSASSNTATTSSKSSSNTTSGVASSSNTSSTSSSHDAYNLYNCLIGATTGDALNDQQEQNLSSMKLKSLQQQSSGASVKLGSSNSINNNDMPLFTFNQVILIVERLLRDQEESIRREFEQVMTQRLAEQYDQFVKFSYDQIQRRFDSQSLPSYLS